ncbi:MAG: glycosyl transferase [Nitrospirales bacterium]|nr:MAG: glycosyl transferase [Nitrospirales bacterium]
MIWVIIPTLNEERALPATLQSVFSQSGKYQVIVVDGGSTDHTQHLIAHDPRLTLLTASRGRASQMNAGAEHAWRLRQSCNDWLLFLHADTMLPTDAFRQLYQLHAQPDCQAGGFAHQFSGNDWRLRFISWLDNFRCNKSHIIYGDQALFVRQGLFEQIGRFPKQPILEDVAFGNTLLHYTVPLLLPSPVVTDARKFLRMGIWKSLTRVLLIILHVEYGLPTLTPAFFQDIR